MALELLVDFGGRCCGSDDGSYRRSEAENEADTDDSIKSNSDRRKEIALDDLDKELADITIDESFNFNSDDDTVENDDDEKRQVENMNFSFPKKKLNGESDLNDCLARSTKPHRGSCIYKQNYKPSENELREIEKLVENLKTVSVTSIKSILQPEKGEPHPVIVIRDRIRCYVVQVNNFNEDNIMTTYYHNSVEVELILLTNALVVSSSLAEAKAEQPQLPTQSKKGIPFFPKSTSKVKTPFKKFFASTSERIEVCEVLSKVDSIIDLETCSKVSLKKLSEECPKEVESDEEDSDEDDQESDMNQEIIKHDRKAFCFIVEDAAYVFFNDKAENHQLWLDSFGTALESSKFQGGENCQDPVMGLRHVTIRTTIYSAVCCNDISMLEKIILGLPKNEIDVPDHAGYRASHYAAIKGYNLCLVRLLDAGANPNALDVHMKTPIDYASERKNVRALEMLEANGGILNDVDKEIIESKRRIVAPSSPPNACPDTSVSETLNQFNERGERLHDVKNKTANLQSAALEYKQMARQMKDKAKAEKIFGLF